MQAAKEKAAVGKLEAIRRDHEKRLGSLGVEAEAAELKARFTGGTALMAAARSLHGEACSRARPLKCARQL